LEKKATPTLQYPGKLTYWHALWLGSFVIPEKKFISGKALFNGTNYTLELIGNWKKIILEQMILWNK
jgi:hypothetical protein